MQRSVKRTDRSRDVLVLQSYSLSVCNMYSMMGDYGAIESLIGRPSKFPVNLVTAPTIFPNDLAPVVIQTRPSTEVMIMRWGFPPAPGRGGRRPHALIRNASSDWWKPWMAKREHRCLVPVTSFCEYDRRTSPPRPTWFATDHARPLFFFAGIWRRGDGTRGGEFSDEQYRFAILIARAGATLESIERTLVPVVLLTSEQREIWMEGSLEQALALQRPEPPGALQIDATGMALS
jgi:putative SOS response-associated peptidase YedK